VATPGEATVRCGGNTSCVEVRCGSRLIVLDSGTGIRELGLGLEKQRVTQMDLLISHFHMDHLQGFPFFTPSYNPGTQIDIHLARRSPGLPLSEPFDKLMEEPHFPVPFSELRANIRFHEANGLCRLGDVSVRSYPVNHPGGCIAFRLEHGGKTLVYLTDHEPYAGEQDQEVREFTRGADLLIREAQYTAAEYELKRGWGHSTFDSVVCDAIDAGVKSLALFHHDPEHDDLFLERELGELQFRYGSSNLDIFLAREGQCVELA
jgi:phosphoribosyl 1,2-cyclic phosphodiesterase